MTINTKLFDLTEEQGVVVITPLGDSISYRDVDVHREGQEITEYLKSSETRKLVIDMSKANYFGSLMIGLINSFGQTVKKSGGQMCLGGASTEMLSIMKVMKIDTLWPHFPTRAHAIKVAKAWS
ncbi:MAG: STAS domain-containing protein [Planctomycetaceae bacterium]|nr:STAS domain-containing protein [Planctomycetaceae bacterium]